MKGVLTSILVTIIIAVLLSFCIEDERSINGLIESGEECLANGDINGAQIKIEEIKNEKLIEYQEYKLNLLEIDVNKERSILTEEKKKIDFEKNKRIHGILLREAPKIFSRISKGTVDDFLR